MIAIKIPSNVPVTEFNKTFVQGMADRMSVSYYKYGAVSDAYPLKVNALESLVKRLQKYQRDGNTEWLVDAANFAMIEFMCPSHKDAHFTPTDSNKSPGRMWHGDIDSSDRANKDY